jgi:predicted solute-binding protein
VKDVARWRVGTVPYLVARPLTEGLDADPRVTLSAAPPARLGESLYAGELDVALASSVLSLGEDALPLWTAGPVIASEDAIRSVLLLLRPGIAGPAEVRRWIADPDSRTGQALATVILAEHGAGAQRIDAPAADAFAAAEAEGADAVQIIGDPAIAAAQAHPDWVSIDLGSAWRALTGLPFVFAGWVGRPGSDPGAAAAPLEDAAARGLDSRARMADAAAAAGEAPQEFLRRYLLEDLSYRLPEEVVRASLAEFARRLGRAEGAE